MEVSELIKKVRELELSSLKHAHSLLTGEYITSIPGKGMQFLEARKYVYGESIRLIDWNMTARLGEPYVKSLHDEREREVVVALDISPSMYTGFQVKTKIELAVEIAATIAISAIQSKDKFGYILFSDRTVDYFKPSSGKTQLFRALKSFLQYSEKAPDSNSGSDIKVALETLQKFKKNRLVVFIISDFLDNDMPDDLRYIRCEHDINFIHVYDTIEYQLSKHIFLPAISTEKNLDSLHSGFIHPGEILSLEEVIENLKKLTLKFKISSTSISTKDDIGKSLKEFFHKKRRVT
jgi:uncharacterized protein (DUF58 family)